MPLEQLDLAALINVTADHAAEKAHQGPILPWADQDASFPPDEMDWVLFAPRLTPGTPYVGFPSYLCAGNPRKAIRAAVPWALAADYVARGARGPTPSANHRLVGRCLDAAFVLPSVHACIRGADEFAGWRLRYRIFNRLMAPPP